ncbi:MAG: hypothetical protein QF444_02025 [Phycisphaerales bacterium]|nr:hypothetical protein [Phycisphaerales bacterium]
MKAKGISVWEQYIEYGVLAIAVLVFAYFTWDTYSNKASIVSGGKTITTANINDELLAEARALSPALDDSAPSPVPIEESKELFDIFKRGLFASTSPKNRVVFPSVDLTAGFSVNRDLVSELRSYAAPAVPAPEHIRAHQWFATVDDSEIGQIPELDEMFVGPPHDATWIQVAAQFDLQGVIEQFQMTGENTSAIPEQWYDGIIDMFDLRLERETLGEDGWSERQLIRVMPGRLTFRHQLAEEKVDTVDRDTIVSQLREGAQNQVVRPQFYHVKGFTSEQVKDPELWDPIDGNEDAEAPETIEGSAAALKEKIRQVTRSLSKLEDTIANLEAAILAEKRSGGGGSPGGPMGTDGTPGGDNSNLEELDRKLMESSQERDELAREREELLAELGKIDSSAAEDLAEAFGGKLWVWAHDLSVNPGSVYRYRVSVEVANPFFGRKPSLYPQEQALADPVTIVSIPSNWSDPIEAQPPLQWFVLRAIPAGSVSSTGPDDYGRVSAEVYHFTDGLWHKDSFQVSAGQRLAAPDGGDFQTEWFVLDMIPWLDASERNLRNNRANWVILQNMRTGATEIVRPWEQASSSRLRDLRLQEQGSQLVDGPF